MMALVACTAILAASDPGSPPPDVAQSYREARAKADRSPEGQVKLALWCEAHGLTAERLNHLALAALADPTNAAARGLMGLVSHEGRFRRPEAVAEAAKADPALLEYEARRLKAPYTAEGQFALGAWADDHGLKDQARAHLTAVVRLDPGREAAWKRLGCRRYGGRWMTEDQVAALKAEAEAQSRADLAWRADLLKWRGWLALPDRRGEAQAALDGVSDPRAVPAIGKVFAPGGPADQALAVRLLGQVDTPGSSRTLALLVTWGRSEEVRRAAAETLSRRDPREYVGSLIGRLRAPVRYQAGLVAGPDGNMHRTLLVEGQDRDTLTYYGRPVGYDRSQPSPGEILDFGFQAASNASSSFGPGQAVTIPGVGTISPHGGHQANAFTPNPAAILLDSVMAAARREAAMEAELARGPSDSPGFQRDLAELESVAIPIERSNARTYAALRMTTGQGFPDDPEAWKKWWLDSLGYASRSESTQPRTPQARPTDFRYVVSCFGAGTPVRTITGDRPIESVRVGDRVLAQDTTTGALGYKPVVVVHHNPPASTLRVVVGDEPILATGFHRFWRPGKGWAMARDLKPGDEVRTLEGLARVSAVEPATVQPVFNLDVADDQTFFVGRSGALVHDNSLPDPRALPFDAAPSTVPAPAPR